jgi:AhpD family alkylhydroperoxidase
MSECLAEARHRCEAVNVSGFITQQTKPTIPMTTMTPRMKNPAEVIPEVLQPIQAISAAAFKSGAAPATHALVHLRISQINGCAQCMDGGAKHAKQAGETDERLFALAGWREAPYYTEAERAALALAESVTRLGDRSDPVPDEIWEEANRHYGEPELAGLLLSIATANFFNRLNVPTRQIAGAQKW